MGDTFDIGRMILVALETWFGTSSGFPVHNWDNCSCADCRVIRVTVQIKKEYQGVKRG